MTALALTVLIAILWLACIALGYWHGGWRQVVLLAAMLLSYAVLSEWAVPNGHDLATRFHWSVSRTTTGVALLYLLGGTFILGFLGSFALYRPRPLDLTERRFGAVMGVLTGGLLLALILRTLRSYAFVAGRGESLHTSLLSRYLIEDVGYLLLGAVVLGGIAAIAGFVAARRDDARETALLESVAIPDGPTAAEPQHEEQASAPVPPALASHPDSHPVPAAVYTNAPLIDWPTSPPPGTQTPPPPAPSKPESPPLAARPQLPPRVPPPLVYPVADLIAAHAKPAIHPANTSPVVASPLPPPPGLSPAPAIAAARPTRPVGPPPGAAHPAFVPPTAARPRTLPERQEPAPADVARESSPPLPPASPEPPPVVRELDVATHDTPPVVRELAVTTQDVPIVRNDAASAAVPRDTAAPETGGGTMKRETPAPESTLPPPTPVVTTAAIPTSPPLLPSAVAKRAAHDEAGPPRSGYARVAVARQASGRPDEPPPGQMHPPTPLQPPLPTGPRVHPCPTCGYPVRDHARYCPNCGSRQGR